MKKFAKILAVCMLVVMVAMTFTSCGLFGLNLKSAAKKLDKAGYKTFYLSEDDIKEIQKNDDISLEDERVDALFAAKLLLNSFFEFKVNDIAPVELIFAISGEDKKPLDDNATIIYSFCAYEFESRDDAKEVFEAMEENFDTDNLDHAFTYGMRGKVVYFGSVDAVKTALGFPANLFVKAK